MKLANSNPLIVRAPTHPQSLALPDGQNTQGVGQYLPAKIFHFTEIRKYRMYRATRPMEEGRIAIVTTRAGRRWAQVTSARSGFAGRATVSEAIAQTTGVIAAYGKIVWSWRPEPVRQGSW
ncbi:hypothetical protein [Bradyrhizobium manausense]|uniref:hypothetical protein n=1 Tax=Bradyrhizobium manausense TaxID=989370 RepID=UPI001FD9E75B|nr:hypothetical protein [Bradyrhizobium manausense]